MPSPIVSLVKAHAVVENGAKQLSGMMRDLRWADQSRSALNAANEAQTEFAKIGLRVPDSVLREWGLALVDCGELAKGFHRLLEYWQRDPTNLEASFLVSGVRLIVPDSQVGSYEDAAVKRAASTVRDGMRGVDRWFELDSDSSTDILEQVDRFGFALIRGAFAGYDDRPDVGEHWWRSLRPEESDGLKAYIHSTPLKGLYDAALEPNWSVHETSVVRQVGAQPSTYLGYHQDINEVRSRTMYLSCWTTFNDSGVELPGLHLAGVPMSTVLPFEHRERAGRHGRYTRTDICDENLGMVPTMEVGDLIVQTMFSVHRTQTLDVTNVVRDSIDFRILSQNLPFQPHSNRVAAITA